MGAGESLNGRGLRGCTGTGIGFQGIDGIPPPKHPSSSPRRGGENVDPVVKVQIYTIPNAPTQPTILFDQSLDSEKTFTEITVTIAFPFSRI